MLAEVWLLSRLTDSRMAVNVALKLLHIEGEQLPLYAWVVIVAALIPLSAISYQLIEKPCRQKMKAWANARQSRPPATVGA